jgi:hypothetical protein
MGVCLLNTIQAQQHHSLPQYCATTASLSSSNSHNDDDDESSSSSKSCTSHEKSEVGEHQIISNMDDNDDDDGTTSVVSFIANDPSMSLSLSLQQHQFHQTQLRRVYKRIHILFYYLFIPIMIIYIAMSVTPYSHNNNNTINNDDVSLVCTVLEPNISPMIPSMMIPSSSSSLCSDDTSNQSSNNSMNMNMEGNGNGFMLMPNVPGLGLYFHFGLVLLLFVYDGIQRTVPIYAPSLFLATISTYHLAILLGTDVLVWDVLQTNFYTTISFTNREVIQRMIQLLWSIVTGCLAYSLHQFWNLRVR